MTSDIQNTPETTTPSPSRSRDQDAAGFRISGQTARLIVVVSPLVLGLLGGAVWITRLDSKTTQNARDLDAMRSEFRSFQSDVGNKLDHISNDIRSLSDQINRLIGKVGMGSMPSETSLANTR